jgi:diguanylate cyclase (GGDEF)-like protein
VPHEVRVPTVFVIRNSCGCNPVASMPPPLPGTETHENALSQRLLHAAEARHLEWVSDSTWPGAGLIQLHFEALLEGRAGLTKQVLSSVWDGFLEVTRDVESIEGALAVLEDWVRQRLEETETAADPELVQRAWIALRKLRIQLLRSWRLSEQERSRYYDFVAEANGKISQALTGTKFSTAKNLSWLRWTRIRYGCLGVWSPPADGQERQLRILGEYGPDGGWGTLLDTCHSPGMFPPPAACDYVERLGFEHVIIVVPIVGARNNRGLMMLVGPVEVELCDHVGSIGDWAALVSTSFEREELEKEMRDNAFRDALTGLPNRALFLDRLDQVISATRRSAGARFAVLFLDLDDFKSINDSLGHIAGDQLIVQVGRRLRDAVRETDSIARLGGDEFALVLPRIESEEEVLEVVNRIQAGLRPAFSLRGNSVFTSCSIGIVFSSARHQGAEELLRDADTAVYRAKFHGRSRHEVFDRGMHTQAVERLELDSRLRRALDREEFVLHYQPLFSLGSGHVVGAEALIRWQHPEQGCLSPSRFLAVAEEVGLAVPISEWVLRTACIEAKQWQRAGTPLRYVNVNVPAQHLKDPTFVRVVEAALAHAELEPAALGLELVESALVEHRKSTIDTLQSLRELGVRTAIDDFGTGNSALSHLKYFPVSSLKIDRGFIQGIPTDLHDSAIAAAVIAMAHDLGLSVVAEGVETQEQVRFLKEHACDVAQGFLLGRPLKAEACRLLMSDHERRHSLVAAAG